MTFSHLRKMIRQVRIKDDHQEGGTPLQQPKRASHIPVLPASSENQSNAQTKFAHGEDQEPVVATVSTAERVRMSGPPPRQTASGQRTSPPETLITVVDSPTLPGRLFTNAYANIKESDVALAEAYEAVLQFELGGESTPKTYGEDSGHTETQHTRAEMVQLVNSGLKRTMTEAAVKRKMQQGMRLVLSVTDLVGNALKYAPEAATAWAGVCLLLQILDNPTSVAGALRSGVSYVISRMDWYWSLSNDLLKNQKSGGPRDELEKRVIVLYESFLTYQMKSICSFSRSRAAVLWRDMFKVDNWTSALQSVKDAEAAVQRDIDTYTNVEKLKAIQDSTKNAENMHRDDETRKCLEDLRLSDPRDDKERIERTKGGLILDTSSWILSHDDFHRLQQCDDARLLWIKGDPGKGKTMLMITIVNELEQQPTSGATLLSYFFCQGTNKDLNNATAVLRGLLYLIATQYPALASHLRESYYAAGSKLFCDGNSFVALSRIFTKILRDESVERAYLVVDALDECIADRDLLLQLIVHHAAASPHIKWIVSSRHRPEIEQRLKLGDSGMTLSLEISENAEQVGRAVEAYVDLKVSELPSLQDDDHRRNEVRAILRKKANGTFLWVAIVIEELHTTSSWDVLEVVEEMPPTLEKLYDRILHQIQQLKRNDPKYCIRVLSAASIAYRPLHLTELGVLADLPKAVSASTKFVREIISLCGCFITVQGDDIVYVIHQSAKDYLNGKAVTSRAEVHRSMFQRSLEVLQQELQRDMYGLRHSGFSMNDFAAPDPDPLRRIRYSTVHWIDHLCEAQNPDDVADDGVAHKFLQGYLIYWIEALGLFRATSHAIVALAKLKDLLSVSKNGIRPIHNTSNALQRIPGSSGLLSLVIDAHRFLLHNRLMIRSTPLQAYVSALLFTPTRSLTRRLFEREKPEWVSRGPIVDENWGSAVTTLATHASFVSATAFSPNGKLLASSSDDKTINIWDIATGETQRTLIGHISSVLSVALSSDGKLVASGSDDKTIKIWDSATGQAQWTLLGHNGSAMSVAFSPDGKMVVSGSEDKIIKIWNIATGKTQRTFIGHNDSVNSVAFSPDGKLVVSGSDDKTIKVWDIATGEAQRTLIGHSDWVMSVEFSPDGKLVVSGSGDKTINIWDIETGEAQRTLVGHSGWVKSVAFSPDGRLVVSGSNDKTIKIWNVATGQTQQTLVGHSDVVRSVAFSPDGKLAVSGSDDKTIKIWDTAVGPGQRVRTDHTNSVNSVAFSPDGKLMASGSEDGSIKIWDAVTGQARRTLLAHSDSVNSVAFSPDGKLVASGSDDDTIKIWNAAAGQAQQTLIGHSLSVNSVAFSPDGKLVVSGSDDKTIKIWDVATGEAQRTLIGHSDWVMSVAFSPDGRLVASGSDDKIIKIWGAATGDVQLTISAPAVARTICFEATGEHLTTNYGRIQINHTVAIENNPLYVRPPPQHRSAMYCVRSDCSWITWGGHNIVCLPPECENGASAVWHGPVPPTTPKVAIGCRSGRVILVCFSDAPPVPT